MSDTSQGPGWWQASDGKWYPPAQADTGSSPATPPASDSPSPSVASPETSATAGSEPETPSEPLPPPGQGDVPFNPKATQVIQRPVLPPEPPGASAPPVSTPTVGTPPVSGPGAASNHAAVPAASPPAFPGADPTGGQGAAAPPPQAQVGAPVGPPAADPTQWQPGPPPVSMTQTPQQFPGAPMGAAAPMAGQSGPGMPFGAGPPAPKKGGAAKIILILAIVLVVIAGLAAGYFLVLNKKKTGADVAAEGGIATANIDSTSPPQLDLHLDAGQLKCEGKEGQLTSSGTLQNNSGATSDYEITVEFRKDNAPLTASPAKVSGVAPGATSSWSVTVEQDVTGQFSCRVVKVNRYNTGTTTPN